MGHRVVLLALVAPAMIGMPTPPVPTVPGSAQAAAAPYLALGVSQDHVAAGHLVTHYRVRRAPGTTLTVAATVTGGSTSSTSSENDTLRLATPAGDACGESSGTWSAGDPLLLLGVALDAGDGLRTGSADACRAASELVVTLDRGTGEVPAGASVDVRLRVTSEPGVTTFAGLPPALDPTSVAQFQARAGAPLATSWTDDLGAPRTLDPGTWRTQLPLNRTVFYRVRLDYGQRAAVTVRPTTPGRVRLTTWARSPVGLDVPQSTGGAYSSEVDVDPDAPATSTLTVSLPEVRYLNRAGSSDVAGSSVPGYYTLAITTTPDDRDPTTWPPPVPATLAVDVRGTPAGQPRYLSAPTGGPVTATPEPSILPASPAITLGATQPGADTGDASTAPWLLGGGLAALALLGAGALVMRRRAG